MNQKQKSELRSKLNEEKELTEKLIIDLKEVTKPIPPENAVGRISRMDAINNKSVNEAALRQAEEKVFNIIKAIERFDAPSFGICIRCGQNIPYGRLIFMPGSSRCVNCAD